MDYAAYINKSTAFIQEKTKQNKTNHTKPLHWSNQSILCENFTFT